jgi:hypothetical protein
MNMLKLLKDTTCLEIATTDGLISLSLAERIVQRFYANDRLIHINILLSAIIKSYLYAQKIISRAIYKLREYNNKCNTTIFT